jgi:hypothetical protein
VVYDKIEILYTKINWYSYLQKVGTQNDR